MAERYRPRRAMVYPPIRESTNELGIVYTVDLSTGSIQFLFDPMPREEAHFHVRAALRRGLREGRYRARDFCPLEASDMADLELYSHDAIASRYYYYDPQEEDAIDDDDDDDMELPGADDVDADGQEEAYGQQQQCFGGVPASGEAIVSLPETSVKVGECGVCLENFEVEAGSKKKLRMMPCSHSFHERCIFHWLSLSHVCPLCRFPLPTQEENE